LRRILDADQRRYGCGIAALWTQGAPELVLSEANPRFDLRNLAPPQPQSCPAARHPLYSALLP
jgi:hypothetical protein